MANFTETLLPALTGVAAQEALYWYDLRNKLDSKKYSAMLHSPVYWIITIITMSVFAAATLFWFYGETVAPKDYLVTAAGFPYIFKRAVSALGKRRDLGDDDKVGNVLQNYFMIG